MDPPKAGALPIDAPGRWRLLAQRGRSRLGAGVAQARASWLVIIQATVAATLAYAVAQAIGHEEPFFAPIAAVATVAISLSQRLKRSSELLLGNAIGILLADLLVARIGSGAWQIGLVVAIALTTAIIAGGGAILIVQSASAAILIVTLMPPTAAEPWNIDRFVDALVGGGVGLAVSALLMPIEPTRYARTATEPVVRVVSDGLRRIGEALATRDAPAATAILADLRDTAPLLASFRAGLDATRESVRLAPWYWGRRSVLRTYALAAVHLDNALRNLRVLARQAMVALDRDEPVPGPLPVALELMARGAAQVGRAMADEDDPEAARRVILRGVAVTADRGGAGGLFSAPMMAQVRLTASDLLQATGLSLEESAARIRAVGDPRDDGEPGRDEANPQATG